MKQFDIGNILFYSGEGVCLIEDIQQKDFFGEQRWYYVLTPVHHCGSKVFVPFEGPAFERLHPLPTEQTAKELLAEAVRLIWIEDDTERKLRFREIIDKGSARERLSVLYSLWEHERSLEGSKKHLRSQDERYKKELERLVCEELSLGCGNSPDAVLQLLTKKLA